MDMLSKFKSRLYSVRTKNNGEDLAGSHVTNVETNEDKPESVPKPNEKW